MESTSNHGQSTAQPDILRLSDTTLTLTAKGDDIRGRKVVDTIGEAIGEVDELMIDVAEKKVRFLQITSGGFLGLGKSVFLIPVDAISWIDSKIVHINHDRKKFVGAPAYNPDMIDRAYLDTLYDYYEYDPFWGSTYRYPAYPHYSMGRRFT